MTTTDAGLTQVEFRNCTNAWWCKITHTVVSWARKWDFDAYRICPKAACKRPCGVSSGNIGLIIIWVFIYIHTLCMRAVKAMARMRIWHAGAFIAGLYDKYSNLVSLPNNMTFVPGKSVQKLTRDTLDITQNLTIQLIAHGSWLIHAIRTEIPQKKLTTRWRHMWYN